MAVALYRRYRPDNFDDLIGQEHVTELLKNALDTGRSTHAYLFSGPRGCGKTTSARIMARCLNCAEGPTATPCGVCESCVELASGGPGSLDVVEIDAASNRGVDDARDLRERAAFAPSRDRYKIFILDEAHMVTKEGSNALLKIVEEPPEHVKFIFATTEPEKVIGTIRSRTHHYPFRLVGPQVLEPYLAELCEKEGVQAEPGVLDLVIRAGGGSVRDSLSVLDQLIAGSSAAGLTLAQATGLLGFTNTAMLEDLTAALSSEDGFRVFQLVEEIIRAGIDPTQLTKDLLQMMRDLVVCGLVPQQAGEVLPHIPADQLQRMLDQSVVWGVRRLSRSADMVDEALRTMSGTMSDRLQLELLLGRLLAGAGAQEPAPATPPTQPETAAQRPTRVQPQRPAPKRDPEPTSPAGESERPNPSAPQRTRRVERDVKPAPQSVPEQAPQEQKVPAFAAGADLQALWSQVVAKSGSVSKVTSIVAEGTKPVELDGGFLSVAPPPALRSRLVPGSNDFVNLERIVAEVFGAGTQLRVGDGNAAPKQTTRPAPQEPPAIPAPVPTVSPTPQSPEIRHPEFPRPEQMPPPVETASDPPVGTSWEPEPAPPVWEQAPEPTPETPQSSSEAEWDEEVSSDDETVAVAPNRGLSALLEVLGGTVIDEQEEI